MNDYPFSAVSIGTPDGWGYFVRECVSFTAWRLKQRGLAYQGFGNAYQWPSQAGSAGLTVDHVPAINSVLCIPALVAGAGTVGHVAWVTALFPGGVVVEDYNWADTHMYAVHNFTIVPGMSFIHTDTGVDSMLFNAGADGWWLLAGGLYTHVADPTDLAAFQKVIPPNQQLVISTAQHQAFLTAAAGIKGSFSLSGTGSIG